MSEDERAIRDLIATWLRASAAGDTEAVLRLMDDDVLFLVPGQPPLRGKAAFAAAQPAPGQFHLEATSEVQEIQVAGTWAHCWTALTVFVTPLAGGSPIKRAGHTLSILRKQADGRWLLVRDANLLVVVP